MIHVQQPHLLPVWMCIPIHVNTELQIHLYFFESYCDLIRNTAIGHDANG